MTLRHHVEALGPALYVGVDIEDGYGVDEICRAEDLRSRYGDDAFDVVISTELLEHVRDWQVVVHNLKHVLKRGGSMLLTTRSFGFPHHGWPHDFWRFEVDDMRAVFADMDIVAIECDPGDPGVLLKALKPQAFRELVPTIDMYSVILGRRASSVSTLQWKAYVVTLPLQRLYRRLVPERSRRRLTRLLGRQTSE
jgi:SAM-dependent methyltransferase